MLTPSTAKDWFRSSLLPSNIRQHLATKKLRKTHPLGIIPAAPKRVICEPTNACNLGCVFCGNRNMVRPWTYMPMPMYKQLLEQMKALDIKRLTLHTVGEPTMHKQLVQMVHMAKEVGMVVTLSTNGTLLDESLARDLVAAAPDILNLSLDAADEETFKEIRKGIDPKAVYENLKTLHRIREAEGREFDSPWGTVKLPTLVGTGLITPVFTEDEARDYFAKYGPYVDDFFFHFPNNHSGYVRDEGMRRRHWLPDRAFDWLYKVSVLLPLPVGRTLPLVRRHHVGLSFRF
ncbi:MAG: radical SAM protein [Planctomycetota bacterium]